MVIRLAKRPDKRSAAATGYRRLYSTKAWRAKRKAQLLAYPLCAYCEALGLFVSATVADHVLPHRGDEDLFFNGATQSLCAPCHDSVKAREEARGYSLEVDLDGYPIDPKHPANAPR